MNQGRTVFSQLISFLPDREFRRCVQRYQGDLRLRGFTCWDQYLAMAFAQLTYRESLPPHSVPPDFRNPRLRFILA
jgi:hypothetical protein